jgi:hypothetical protein
MPRVVPSQVVAFIEKLFQPEAQRSENFYLSRDHVGHLMTIIDSTYRFTCLGCGQNISEQEITTLLVERMRQFYEEQT